MEVSSATALRPAVLAPKLDLEEIGKLVCLTRQGKNFFQLANKLLLSLDNVEDQKALLIKNYAPVDFMKEFFEGLESDDKRAELIFKSLDDKESAFLDTTLKTIDNINNFPELINSIGKLLLAKEGNQDGTFSETDCILAVAKHSKLKHLANVKALAGVSLPTTQNLLAIPKGNDFPPGAFYSKGIIPHLSGSDFQEAVQLFKTINKEDQLRALVDLAISGENPLVFSILELIEDKNLNSDFVNALILHLKDEHSGVVAELNSNHRNEISSLESRISQMEVSHREHIESINDSWSERVYGPVDMTR